MMREGHHPSRVAMSGPVSPTGPDNIIIALIRYVHFWGGGAKNPYLGKSKAFPKLTRDSFLFMQIFSQSYLLYYFKRRTFNPDYYLSLLNLYEERIYIKTFSQIFNSQISHNGSWPVKSYVTRCAVKCHKYAMIVGDNFQNQFTLKNTSLPYI